MALALEDAESELPTKMNALENVSFPLPLATPSETATTLRRAPSIPPVIVSRSTAPMVSPVNVAPSGPPAKLASTPSPSRKPPPPLPKKAGTSLPPPLRRSSRPPPPLPARVSSNAAQANADVVTSLPPLPPIAPPPLLPRIDEPLPKLGSLEVFGDLPPLGLAPIDGMDFPAEENTQARPVDDALLERTRDDVTETAPTRKRPSTRPSTRPGPMPRAPHPMSASIDGTEPTTRAAPMPETMVRSDFGELGVLRKRKSDRAPAEDGLSEEPSGERERPSPILYAAPVPSFDDVNPESEWSDGGYDGGALPGFASNDPTDSTVTELPSSPWPSRQAPPAPVNGSDDLSTAAERAPVPPGRYAPPSWSLSPSRRPAAGLVGHPSSFPPAHSAPAHALPAHSVPVHSVAGAHPSPYPPAPPLGFSQAAIAYASSPMFQPQVPTVLTPPPPPRPMRGMWFVAGTAFGVAFMFFATGLFGRSSAEAEAPAPVASPAQTVRARPPAPRPAPAPRAPEMAASPTVAAPPSVPVSSLPPTVLAVSGVAPKSAPPAEAPAPKAEPVASKSSTSSRHASKSSHTSSSSASSERRSGSAGTPDVASTFGDALGNEPSKSKASGSRASTKRAPADDPDGLMDGADPTDLLGAALKP